MRNKKIAIAFYGITRSLKHTITSIENNIINPAKEIGEVKIFCHFFNQKIIENPRTNESGALDPYEWQLLNADVNLIEEIDNYKENSIYEELIQYGNSWEDDGQSLKNILRQLLSLQKITRIIKEDGQFDLIIFARPDMLYHDSIYEIIKNNKVNKNNICIPYWSWSGGLNDRFAICSKSSYEIYGERISHSLDYCISKKKPMHSERLLMYALQKSSVQLNLISTRATRIRSDGSHAHEIFNKVKIAKRIEAFIFCNIKTYINFKVKLIKNIF